MDSSSRGPEPAKPLVAPSSHRRPRAARRLGYATVALLFVFGVIVPSAVAEMRAFGSTGSEQTFTVPAGVTSVHVVAG
jgi:hypothetical protein